MKPLRPQINTRMLTHGECNRLGLYAYAGIGDTVQTYRVRNKNREWRYVSHGTEEYTRAVEAAERLT